MKIIRSAIVVVLLVGIGSGIVIANKANEGEGDCITISPSTLVLSSFSGDVTVHSNIVYALVDCSSLELKNPAGDVVTPDSTKRDDCGHLVAKFNTEDVRDIVEPGQVTLTLSGVLEDSTLFAASDTITVKD